MGCFWGCGAFGVGFGWSVYYNLTLLNCGCNRQSSSKLDSALVCSQFIVDACEEHAILVVLEEEIAHGFEGRACGDEIVEYDAVRLSGQHVERELGTDALLGMTVGNILVERDAQLPGDVLADARGEVLDEVATLGSGDDTPIACV